ncbi:MAG: hypothetical protein GXP10_01980, partial [Gammaproteobacteria bacterium]|nr:hypothetical protein [Gammaproteobacteria bacterium]
LADYGFAKDVTGSGDQGTRKKYIAFTGVEKLQDALNEIRIFRPDSNQLIINVSSSYENVLWVTYAAIDKLPSSVIEGQLYSVEGVVVLGASAPKNCRLLLCAGGDEYDVEWGIESSWMAKKYPKAPNCQLSRFKIQNFRATKGMEYRLCVAADDDASILFSIIVDKL